jgi:hypothetical protein
MLVKQQLVGGLEPWNFMTFHSVGNVILPTVTQSIIFQRASCTTQINVDQSMPFAPPCSWEMVQFIAIKFGDLGGRFIRILPT